MANALTIIAIAASVLSGGAMGSFDLTPEKWT